MVFSRWAIHRRVEEANSAWMVRWTFASVSTSTLLVASSCDSEIERWIRDQYPEHTHQNDDSTVFYQRTAKGKELLLSSAIVRACM